MTTRTGLVGLGTGIVVSGVLFYPLYTVWPGFYIGGWPAASRPLGILLVMLAAALLVLCGGLAAAWNGAGSSDQRLVLGALAGGLAGLVLFCALGAAAAGVVGMSRSPTITRVAAERWLVADACVQIIDWTHRAFWGLTLAGAGLGALGSVWIAPAIQDRLQRDTEETHSPMMALNTTLTALPSTAVAVILAVGLFAHLPDLLQLDNAAIKPRLSQLILDWPMATALLLYLAAHLALTLVVPHEAQQAEHRCAIDEVKMAAYVGIGVPLALVVALGLIAPRHGPPWVFTLRVLGSLLISTAMAAYLIHVLFSLIFPIRAKMPPPRDRWEAAFFGTIASSRWQSLVLLCLGCGIVMAAPAYVAVASVTITMTFMPVVSSTLGWAPTASVELVRSLYLTQALAGLGSSLVAALALTALYLFYLGLGKGFRWIKGHSRSQSTI